MPGAPRREDDAASASSAGSASSTGSSGSNKGYQERMSEQDEMDADVITNALSFRKSIFGVLHTLATVKYDSLLRFAAARIILDYLQLFLLLMRPAHGFVFNTQLWVWQAIKWIEFANPLTSDGYEFYVWWVYVGVIALIAACGIAVWTGFHFRRNNFPYIWPIMLLRVTVNATVFLFYISCFTVFMVGFNCNWFMEEGGTQRAVVDATGASIIEVTDIRFRVNRFPDRECLALPHLIHGIVALVACGVFVTAAFFMTLTDYDADPASRRWMASAHSSVEIWALTIKTFMVLNVGIFASQLYIQSVIFCITSLALAYLYIRWQPHYNEWVNHIRSGLYTSLFWMAAFIAVMKFDDKWDVPGHRKWLTDAMLIGLAPVMVLGFAVSWLRLNLSTRRILKAIVSAPEGCRVKDMYWFSTPEEVEIVSRVGRRWLKEDDEVLDPEAVSLAERVIAVGQAHFPDNSKMAIAHANFVFSLQNNHQLGTSLRLHVMKLEDCTMADEYIVFSGLQDGKATADAAEEDTHNLAVFVEFQRYMRMLARSHRAALMALRKFWLSLLHQDVSFSTLMEGFVEVDETAKATDKMFQVLLERYPKSDRLFRMYARFLENIRNDPWTASKFTMMADKVDESEADAAATALPRDDDDALDMLGSMNEKIHAVIVISAEGIIMVANKLAQKMMGYKNTEMEGKNVSMLMPPPFNQRHNGYLRSYINTGRAKFMGCAREVVALHKDRSVFPLQLAVTKVSGVGSDSVFLGVMRVREMPPGIIRVWCTPAGGVISVDKRFFDSFGKKYEDVAGRPFLSLVRDQDAVMKLLDRALTASEDDFKSGKIKEKGVFMLHRYTEPVEVDISVELGGTDSQRLLALNLTCTKSQGMMIVTNDKGRLLYLNADVRNLLGIDPTADVGKLDLSQLMPPPYSLLHAKWVREPSAKVPKQSCRSGATVVMANTTTGVHIPIRPTITTREVDENKQYVIHVEVSNWERGLSERRLELTLDSCGIVVSVSALSSLFGFQPQQLVGTCVSSIVDVLSELHDDLQNVLAKMARKAMARPGYSWRVGVFPPSKPKAELSEIELRILEKITQPALMMLQLEEVSEDELPIIKLHLYKANMLNGIIEVDQSGIITRPAVSQLDPTGLLFGCAESSMTRRPIRHYITLPGKSPESLLEDDKVKGVMKTGTQGRKVGPLKILTGMHADGSLLKLKVLAMSTANRKVVIKCNFDTLVKGDTRLFNDTLNDDVPKGRRGSTWAKSEVDDDAKSLAPEAAGKDMAAALKKGVKFAGGGESPSSSSGSNGGDDEDEGEGNAERKEEDVEEVVLEVEADDEASEVVDMEAAAAAAEAIATDWQRGRRLKKVYQMLTTVHAKADYTRYVQHMYCILALVCAVHTILFVVVLLNVSDFNAKVAVLDGCGRATFEVTGLIVEIQKLRNMYTGPTDPGIYVMDEASLKKTLEVLETHVTDLQWAHQGVYLGFGKLQRIRDQFQLREIWEGANVKEGIYIDTRVPATEEDQSNLWLMGNQLLASAREVIVNHKKISIETTNRFNLNREYRYIADNGVNYIAPQYVRSLNGLLQSDILALQSSANMIYGIMVVDVLTAVGAAVWVFFLLRNVLNVRHALMSVFLTVPTGFLRALAELQMAMAERDADGVGGGEEEEEDEAVKLATVTQAAAGTTNVTVIPVHGKGKDDNPRNKPFVIDVDAMAAGTYAGLEDSSWSERTIAAVRGAWTKVAAFISGLAGAPLEVGKRKLLRHSRDLLWQVTPWLVWAIIVLVIFMETAKAVTQLSRPMRNNYLANRLASRSARVVSDAQEMCSQSTPEAVAAIASGGMKARFSELKHMYASLLYGQATDKRDMSFLTLDGALFDSLDTQTTFFRDKGTCWADDAEYCYKPGHKFYSVTSHGLDPMMQRLFEEVKLLMADDPAQVALEGIRNERFSFIWNVGWHSLDNGLLQAATVFSATASTAFQQAIVAQVALFVLCWVFATAYYFFLVRPFKNLSEHEVRQAAELLSQLPADMHIESAVAQMVIPYDPSMDNTQGKGMRATGGGTGGGDVHARAERTSGEKGSSKSDA